uniref:Glycosyl transferase group 1 n=1 Tax=Cyanothece sp. (strain PCC 7425 / ATCC 29141) TaxID=395961 RepID=B8HLM7_CYAP4
MLTPSPCHSLTPASNSADPTASKPAVIVYCDDLLRPSATFVRSQGEALANFNPYYVGTRLLKGLSLPPQRTIAVNRWGKLGFLSEVLYRQWEVAPSFWQNLKQCQPQLIHAHFGPDGVLALPLAHRLDIPLIVTFHGFDATTKDEYARRSFSKHRHYLQQRDTLKTEAALFIAVSDFIRSKLLEQGFPAEKVVVHHIGVNTSEFQRDPRIEREPIVLFVGRLVEKKGCEYLIRAMAQVQQSLPDVKLVIIGDGPLRPQLEALAAQLLSNYEFLGLQPPCMVKVWMNRARLLCSPSVTAASGDAEGIPMVILEAQSMGLPVVSSDHAGIPDAVAHGETGFLAPERDWVALSTYLQHLLTDTDLWTQFSQAGQERVQTQFDLQKQTAQLEQLYQQVLDQRGLERAHKGFFPNRPGQAQPPTSATAISSQTLLELEGHGLPQPPHPLEHQHRLGYLSGAPRVSTRPQAEASGPRAHILGVIRAFEALDWEVETFIAGDWVPLPWVAKGSERTLRSNPWRTLAADLLRIWMNYRNQRRAWKLFGPKVDWVYERFGAFQSLGRYFQQRGQVPWILETNALLYEEAKLERQSIILADLARALELRAYRQCDLLVCISQALKERIVQVAGIPADKVLVVHNGVDTQWFDPQRYQPRRLFSGLTIGFVGGLFVWQGLDLLLQALHELKRDEDLSFNLVVIGDGVMRQPWETLAAKLGLNEQVKFTGWLSPAQLPPYLAGFDLGFSGHLDVQGRAVYRSPLKLYEYMAMAKPVITSEVEDTQTLVRVGETGFLFPAGDLQGLKQALRSAWQQQNHLAAMGAQARADVVAHHSWQARVSQMMVEVEHRLNGGNVKPDGAHVNFNNGNVKPDGASVNLNNGNVKPDGASVEDNHASVNAADHSVDLKLVSSQLQP